MIPAIKQNQHHLQQQQQQLQPQHSHVLQSQLKPQFKQHQKYQQQQHQQPHHDNYLKAQSSALTQSSKLLPTSNNSSQSLRMFAYRRPLTPLVDSMSSSYHQQNEHPLLQQQQQQQQKHESNNNNNNLANPSRNPRSGGDNSRGVPTATAPATTTTTPTNSNELLQQKIPFTFSANSNSIHGDRMTYANSNSSSPSRALAKRKQQKHLSKYHRQNQNERNQLLSLAYEIHNPNQFYRSTSSSLRQQQEHDNITTTANCLSPRNPSNNSFQFSSTKKRVKKPKKQSQQYYDQLSATRIPPDHISPVDILSSSQMKNLMSDQELENYTESKFSTYTNKQRATRSQSYSQQHQSELASSLLLPKTEQFNSTESSPARQLQSAGVTVNMPSRENNGKLPMSYDQLRYQSANTSSLEINIKQLESPLGKSKAQASRGNSPQIYSSIQSRSSQQQQQQQQPSTLFSEKKRLQQLKLFGGSSNQNDVGQNNKYSAAQQTTEQTYDPCDSPKSGNQNNNNSSYKQLKKPLSQNQQSLKDEKETKDSNSNNNSDVKNMNKRYEVPLTWNQMRQRTAEIRSTTKSMQVIQWRMGELMAIKQQKEHEALLRKLLEDPNSFFRYSLDIQPHEAAALTSSATIRKPSKQEILQSTRYNTLYKSIKSKEAFNKFGDTSPKQIYNKKSNNGNTIQQQSAKK